MRFRRIGADNFVMQLTAPKKPSQSLTCPGPIQALASCRSALVAFHSHCGCTIFHEDGSVALNTLEGAKLFACSEDTVLLVDTTGSGQSIAATGLSFEREKLALEGLHSCRALALAHSGYRSSNKPWAVAAPSNRYVLRANLKFLIDFASHIQKKVSSSEIPTARLLGAVPYLSVSMHGAMHAELCAQF